MFNLFKKKEASFKFKESENTACFTCDHVLNKQRPVLYVSHDAVDGSWQFMCGQNDHVDANMKIISLKQITEIDESVNDLFEMRLGVGAEREKVDDKWQPFKI